ncbi:Hypothetical protein NocV09_01700450 [Nannochloropsis oceanica]
MQRPIAVVLTLLLCFQSVVSFLLPTPIVVRSATAPARGAGAVQMNGVTDAITSYVGIWSPTIRTIVADANIPTALIKWFHGANMGIVLTTMASFGAYLGWKIRNGLIGIALLAFQALLPKLFDGNSGETARTAHAYLGSATMALLFIHAGFGLQLGFSF